MTTNKKVIVYIDGYNLYYGRLKNTTYKWLDLVTLFEREIIRSQIPHAELIKVKYFTSPVLARFCSHGKQGEEMQTRYHNALKASAPDKLEIILGFHTAESVFMPKFHEGQTIVDKNDNLQVWKLNEKQTDVKIALHLYRDVKNQAADAYIVCSNDTDLVPVLQMIREERLPGELGLVVPRHPPDDGKQRPPNAALSTLSDWTRNYIRDEELQASQFPRVVTRPKKKPLVKPEYW